MAALLWPPRPGGLFIGMVIALGIEQPFVAAIFCPIIGVILVIVLWKPLSEAGDWFSIFPVIISGLILLGSGGFGLALVLQNRAITGITAFIKIIALLLNGLILTPFAVLFILPFIVPLINLLWQICHSLLGKISRKKHP